jgi:tetratricopeptide (TPR) repeat protein
VDSLPPPDSFHLDAAMGWLLLDNLEEALHELSRIQSQHRNHPDVLEFNWILRARQFDWSACLETGQALVEVAPERAAGWIHRAYALRRIEGGSLQLAWESLLPAAERFPDETIIPYNLACYACQLNDLPSARTWLNRALEIAARSGDKSHWIETALHDPDLEPLWPEIRR